MWSGSERYASFSKLFCSIGRAFKLVLHINCGQKIGGTTKDSRGDIVSALTPGGHKRT
jgi:hypothetical protein